MTTPNPADPADPTDPRAAAERIVALAEKAEPGPWTTGGFTYPNDPEKIRTSIWGPRREPHHQSGLWIADDVTVNESNFIAEARALAPILARAHALPAASTCDSTARASAPSGADAAHAARSAPDASAVTSAPRMARALPASRSACAGCPRYHSSVRAASGEVRAMAASRSATRSTACPVP